MKGMKVNDTREGKVRCPYIDCTEELDIVDFDFMFKVDPRFRQEWYGEIWRCTVHGLLLHGSLLPKEKR